MNVHPTGGIQGPQPVQPTRPTTKPERAEAAPAAARADRVEISDRARFLEKLSRLPEVRAEKIDAVRKGIAEGVYDSDEKLRAAVDRLLEETF